jgi:hypothetical protein
MQLLPSGRVRIAPGNITRLTCLQLLHKTLLQKACRASPIVFWVSMENRKADRKEWKPRKQLPSTLHTPAVTHRTSQQRRITVGGDSYACMSSLACGGSVTLLACFAC